VPRSGGGLAPEPAPGWLDFRKVELRRAVTRWVTSARAWRTCLKRQASKEQRSHGSNDQ